MGSPALTSNGRGWPFADLVCTRCVPGKINVRVDVPTFLVSPDGRRRVHWDLIRLEGTYLMATPATRLHAGEKADARGLSEAAVAAIAGHKMAGFDIEDVDVELLRAYERGEFTVEEFVAKVKAANAGR